MEGETMLGILIRREWLRGTGRGKARTAIP